MQRLFLPKLIDTSTANWINDFPMEDLTDLILKGLPQATQINDSGTLERDTIQVDAQGVLDATIKGKPEDTQNTWTKAKGKKRLK